MRFVCWDSSTNRSEPIHQRGCWHLNRDDALRNSCVSTTKHSTKHKHAFTHLGSAADDDRVALRPTNVRIIERLETRREVFTHFSSTNHVPFVHTIVNEFRDWSGTFTGLVRCCIEDNLFGFCSDVRCFHRVLIRKLHDLLTSVSNTMNASLIVNTISPSRYTSLGSSVAYK